MLAGILTRVSQDRDGQARSVLGQRTACEAACQDMAWPVYAVYEDNDLSASRYARKPRPGWEKLLADVKTRKFQVIVLWEPSRGSRNLEEWARFIHLCNVRGMLIHVVSHGRTYNASNARDRRSLHEDGVDAEFESEKTAERARRGWDASAQAGRPHGKPPRGYSLRYTPTGEREWVPDEAAGDVVKAITRIARSEAVTAIARDLGWTPAVVRMVARNRAYIAEREWKGEHLPGTWPAIVDRETWLQAQAVLASRERGRQPGAVKHLVSYIGTCGVCERRLMVRGRSYTCESGHVAMLIHLLDGWVTRETLQYLRQDGWPERLAWGDEGAALAAENATRLRLRLSEAASACARGEISISGFAAIERDLKPAVDAAEAEAARVGVPFVFSDLPTRGEIEAWWGGLQVIQRRDALKAIVQALVLNRAGQAERLIVNFR